MLSIAILSTIYCAAAPEAASQKDDINLGSSEVGSAILLEFLCSWSSELCPIPDLGFESSTTTLCNLDPTLEHVIVNVHGSL